MPVDELIVQDEWELLLKELIVKPCSRIAGNSLALFRVQASLEYIQEGYPAGKPEYILEGYPAGKPEYILEGYPAGKPEYIQEGYPAG